MIGLESERRGVGGCGVGADGMAIDEGRNVARQVLALAQAWPAILERMRSPENEQGVRLWLASPKVKPIEITEGVLTLECPTARMLLQVHDELLFEVPEADASGLSSVARRVMESAATLSVPLVVETGTGRTWAEAH